MLGMCVGTAVSELVDPPDKRMTFGSEEVNGPQGEHFLRLTKIQDPLGSIKDLDRDESENESITAQARILKADHKPKPTQSTKGEPSRGSKIISIEEIDSEPESEDEDLPVYAKPDSDPSDSDEDPTLIERNKPAAPV